MEYEIIVGKRNNTDLVLLDICSNGNLLETRSIKQIKIFQGKVINRFVYNLNKSIYNLNKSLDSCMLK